jgi:CHAT domain-containing protein
VLQALLEGGYDLVHYTGHGDFDEVDGTRAGWVFEGGLLTSRELELLTTAPRLVVANACLSGLTSRARGATTQRASRREAGLLPSLADEFFRRGVRDYVGTAWEVDDEGAVLFAKEFYEALLAQETIGSAMQRARNTLRGEEERYGALWAAYQHYGDLRTRLIGSTSPAASPAPSRARRRKSPARKPRRVKRRR